MEKFQIRDDNNNVVDRDLSFEEALMWIDNSIGSYIMEPMKEKER